MADWQPIETAPSNPEDEPILVADGRKVMIAISRTESFWVGADNGVLYPEWWMPLPKPPP